jgi:hypothetical protein
LNRAQGISIVVVPSRPCSASFHRRGSGDRDVAVPFTVVGTLVSKGANEDDDFTIRNMEVLKAQETSARVMSGFSRDCISFTQRSAASAS